jgi:hypothetical protein
MFSVVVLGHKNSYRIYEFVNKEIGRRMCRPIASGGQMAVSPKITAEV